MNKKKERESQAIEALIAMALHPNSEEIQSKVSEKLNDVHSKVNDWRCQKCGRALGWCEPVICDKCLNSINDVHSKDFKSKVDWTRLFPRKEGTSNQERIAYLVEFITHRRGSRVAVNKAIKELSKLNP